MRRRRIRRRQHRIAQKAMDRGHCSTMLCTVLYSIKSASGGTTTTNNGYCKYYCFFVESTSTTTNNLLLQCATWHPLLHTAATRNLIGHYSRYQVSWIPGRKPHSGRALTWIRTTNPKGRTYRHGWTGLAKVL